MKFTLDRAGLGRLLSTGQAANVLSGVAAGIARDWQRLDPRNRAGGHRPPVVRVVPMGELDGVAAVAATSDDSFWHLIEYGSVNNPPYAPIRQAVRANGLDLKDRR